MLPHQVGVLISAVKAKEVTNAAKEPQDLSLKQCSWHHLATVSNPHSQWAYLNDTLHGSQCLMIEVSLQDVSLRQAHPFEWGTVMHVSANHGIMHCC